MNAAILDALPAADDELLLDLLNTAPVVDGVPRDALDDETAAREWQETRGGRGSREELTQLRRARSILKAVVRGERTGEALAPLLDAVSFVRWPPTPACPGR